MSFIKQPPLPSCRTPVDDGSGDGYSPYAASTAATSIAPTPSAFFPKHALDLPNLRTRPSAQVLLTTLALFSSAQDVRNFGSETPEENGVFSAAPGSGGFKWLTTLVGSPLEWIADEDEKDLILNQASTRLAERCGRTAAPRMTRKISVENLQDAVFERRRIPPDEQAPIALEEPALTEDSLGLKTWGSALILAERFVRDSDILVDPVLELGAGTGLCGIVASRLGYDVTVTDLPEIVPNLRHNVNFNKLPSDDVQAEVLDWADPQRSLLYDRAGTYKTLVVADPVYQMDHTDLVSSIVNLFLARTNDARLCLQLPERAKFEDVREALKSKLEAGGLKVVRQDKQEGYDDFGRQSYDWTLWMWK